ncbi:MAG: prepilin-type N-terminal cleavage/methylation domain-containing protein [Nautiliaceae bacterium]
MKKGWTLIEILISISILSILFLAMSNIIGNLKISKNFLKNNLKKSKKEELLIKTFYSDIMNAKKIKILNTSKNYIRLILKTSNSLYDLINPNVIWYVSKNGNTLIRAESYLKIKNNNFYYADKFMQNVKKFKILKKNRKYFVYIKSIKPIFFEFQF